MMVRIRQSPVALTLKAIRRRWDLAEVLTFLLTKNVIFKKNIGGINERINADSEFKFRDGFNAESYYIRADAEGRNIIQ